MSTGNGFHAPLEAEWLNEAVHTASLTYFDKPAAHRGEGGSIPFMAMLLDKFPDAQVQSAPFHALLSPSIPHKFPDAQFLVTGCAGPGSNMHAPNEFLHIDYAARLTMCVAQIVAALATQKAGEQAGQQAGEQAGEGASSAQRAVTAPAGQGKKPISFLQAFQQSGGNGLFFVGCDCGQTGCVIFEQGKEKFCPPVKQQKTA